MEEGITNPPAEVALWHEEALARLDVSRGASGRPVLSGSLAGRIENTVLSLGASDGDVARACREARDFGMRGVCCLPRDVRRCRDLLGAGAQRVVTVVGFPLCGGCAGAAAREGRRAVEDGADELDMVIDVRSLRAGELARCRDLVAEVVDAAAGRPVKVILETGLLTEREAVWGATAAEAGGAAFVKTCTGFGPRGATLEDVRLLRAAVGERMGIKAAGGIRDHAFASALVDAGADVLGASNGLACLGKDD
ncbi:MAG: deoxyribose-phosphate aldolase [Deltaproteobacteria bacterium]|nr:deoxyribose-phosphate aldolase [Deltaproteobacteria bacterium]